MKEYHDINFVDNLPIADIQEHVTLIIQDRNEANLWLLYCNIFPTFTEKTYKSFEEFKNPCQKVSSENSEESIQKILDDTKLILASIQK